MSHPCDCNSCVISRALGSIHRALAEIDDARNNQLEKDEDLSMNFAYLLDEARLVVSNTEVPEAVRIHFGHVIEAVTR